MTKNIVDDIFFLAWEQKWPSEKVSFKYMDRKKDNTLEVSEPVRWSKTLFPLTLIVQKEGSK